MLTCSGCAVLQPGIPGSGILQTEVRPATPFDQIEVGGISNVQVIVGEQPSVTVATDDNLLAHVETTVTDGTLKVRTRGAIHPRSGLNVHVTVPQLNSLRVSGAGEVQAHGISGDAVEMTISGAGSLTADGSVRHLRARVSGAGSADLQDLIAQSANVGVSGAGDAKVHALEALTANASGAGDITCYGNPLHVDKRVSGAGDVTLQADAAQWVHLGDEPGNPDEPGMR